MFRKVRQREYSIKRSEQERYITSNWFTYQGISGSYKIEKSSSNPRRVVVRVAYDKDYLSRSEVSSWESGCETWLRRQLSEYDIACFYF